MENNKNFDKLFIRPIIPDQFVDVNFRCPSNCLNCDRIRKKKRITFYSQCMLTNLNERIPLCTDKEELDDLYELRQQYVNKLNLEIKKLR